MALYPVPWFTTGGVEGEGGAENYGELARAATYASTMAATGIIEPTDLQVKALPTPGGAVRVHKGSGVIKSTYPGVIGQSYVVQEDSYTDVPVAATGSSGGATKYVYLLIEDTQYTGQPPASVADGPYNSYQVTTTLPQFQPYLLLAKISQPKSTATITNAMITDLRELAQPKMWTFPFSRPRVAADSSPQNLLTARNATGGEFFPGGAGYANEFQVPVPEWAARMIITPTWHSLEVKAGKNSWGTMWMEYGTEYRPNTWPLNRQYEFGTQSFFWNTVGAGNSYTFDKSLSDNQGVPNKLKGKLVTFVFKASVSDRPDAETGALAMGPLGGLSCNITFLQEPLGYEGS